MDVATTKLQQLLSQTINCLDTCTKLLSDFVQLQKELKKWKQGDTHTPISDE